MKWSEITHEHHGMCADVTDIYNCRSFGLISYPTTNPRPILYVSGDKPHTYEGSAKVELVD